MAKVIKLFSTQLHRSAKIMEKYAAISINYALKSFIILATGKVVSVNKKAYV
jgi:hypothetical protein